MKQDHDPGSSTMPLPDISPWIFKMRLRFRSLSARQTSEKIFFLKHRRTTKVVPSTLSTLSTLLCDYNNGVSTCATMSTMLRSITLLCGQEHIGPLAPVRGTVFKCLLVHATCFHAAYPSSESFGPPSPSTEALYFTQSAHSSVRGVVIITPLSINECSSIGLLASRCSVLPSLCAFCSPIFPPTKGIWPILSSSLSSCLEFLCGFFDHDVSSCPRHLEQGRKHVCETESEVTKAQPSSRGSKSSAGKSQAMHIRLKQWHEHMFNIVTIVDTASTVVSWHFQKSWHHELFRMVNIVDIIHFVVWTQWWRELKVCVSLFFFEGSSKRVMFLLSNVLRKYSHGVPIIKYTQSK